MHKDIQFSPAAWKIETASMSRIMASVYHAICLYNWEKAAPVSVSYLKIILSDIPEDQAIWLINGLLELEAIQQDEANENKLFSPSAMAAGQAAYAVWHAKSRGGASGRKATGKPAATPPKPNDGEEEEELEAIKKINAAKEQRKAINADIKRVAEAWNTMAAAAKLPQIEKLTESRKTAIEQRLGEHSADKIVTAIATVPKSRYLMGDNDRKWRANFDWLCRPDRCAKLIEGGYHAADESKTPAAPTKPQEPILAVEGEGEDGGKIRRQLLAHLGLVPFCTYVNAVTFEPVPESKAIRVNGMMATRLKEAHGGVLERIVKQIGYGEVW